jgi:hypothetical protein
MRRIYSARGLRLAGFGHGIGLDPKCLATVIPSKREDLAGEWLERGAQRSPQLKGSLRMTSAL